MPIKIAYEKRWRFRLCLFLFFLIYFLFSSFYFLTPTYAQTVQSEVTVSATIAALTGNIQISGHTSPGAVVTILKDGSVAGTTTANSGSAFEKTLTGLTPATYTFSMYSTDPKGRTSLTISFQTAIISGLTISLSGFILPPTLSVQKPTLKRPDAQIADGYARHDAQVSSFFNSDTILKQVDTDSEGKWEARVTDIFHLGNHSASALVQDRNGNQSVSSQTEPFTVVLSADLNIDEKVNLTDFSILMFNYGRVSPPNVAADINDNGGMPDLVDFSIMMYYWTGG